MKLSKLPSITLFLFLIAMEVQAQTGFYDESKIQEIKLVFSYSNWDYRLDTAKAGKEDYILATSCTINGQTFDSVGVKYKGNSSYRSTNAKNPLHIELDWKKENQDYQFWTSLMFWQSTLLGGGGAMTAAK